MINKLRLLLNLECRDDYVKLMPIRFSDDSILISFWNYCGWTLKKSTCDGLLIIVLSILCIGSCAVPEPDGKGTLRPVISPNVDLVPSIRERKAPPILGVRFIKTIGRTGQGAGEYLKPMGLVLDAYGQLYVADAGNNRIQVVDIDGNFVAEFGNYGWRDGEFDHPKDVALSLDTLYVADTGNDRVQYCNLVHRIFYTIITTSEAYEFDAPEGINVGRNGEVYVVDTLNHRWIQFTRDLVPVFTMGSFGSNREQFWNPTSIVVNPHNTVYVVDTGNNSIKTFDFSGNPIHTWGEEGSALGQFRIPKRIALDTWNYLYVTDSGNRRVQIFTPEGQAILDFTDKSLLNPCGITVSKKGMVYVSDTDAGDIKVFHVVYKADAAKTD